MSLAGIKTAVDQLSPNEFVELIAFIRERAIKSSEIPQDFIEALEDFENQRFVSMETALNEKPPAREISVSRG
jgi:hypothetical protein